MFSQQIKRKMAESITLQVELSNCDATVIYWNELKKLWH